MNLVVSAVIIHPFPGCLKSVGEKADFVRFLKFKGMLHSLFLRFAQVKDNFTNVCESYYECHLRYVEKSEGYNPINLFSYTWFPHRTRCCNLKGQLGQKLSLLFLFVLSHGGESNWLLVSLKQHPTL